jgi:glycine cleavage system H protein
VDPADRKYTQEHEWVRLDGDTAVVGITYFAQDQLGDVVYVELPKVGDRVEQMKPFGVIESVKTASDLFAPVTGTVVEVNQAAIDDPALVSSDPYGQGWLLRVDVSETGPLLTAEQYRAQVEV